MLCIGVTEVNSCQQHLTLCAVLNKRALKSLVLGSSGLLEEESGSVRKKLLIIVRSLIQVHSGFAAHATLDLFISYICSLVIYYTSFLLIHF